ncbi:hypothetical protein EON63_12475, partial [archaeon]
MWGLPYPHQPPHHSTHTNTRETVRVQSHGGKEINRHERVSTDRVSQQQPSAEPVGSEGRCSLTPTPTLTST